MSTEPLAGKRILSFVGEIYEDLELWYPKLRMIEAGAEFVVAGPDAETRYAGKHGYPCVSDAKIDDMAAKDFDGLLCPGGFMPDKLRRDAKVLQIVRDFHGLFNLRCCVNKCIKKRACAGAAHEAGIYEQTRGAP